VILLAGHDTWQQDWLWVGGNYEDMDGAEVEHGLEEGNAGMWRLVGDWLLPFVDAVVDWLETLRSLQRGFLRQG